MNNPVLVLRIINKAIEDKHRNESVVVFINGFQATTENLESLYNAILNGTDYLLSHFHSKCGYWYFKTV